MGIRTNRDSLVRVAVVGQIAPQEFGMAPYRISHEGVPRVVPGTGGITYNVRVGDRIKGIVGDHVEPAVSARNPEALRDQARALLTTVESPVDVAYSLK